ncbi:hypothetical protein DVK05_15155 [Halorubrum sp. Atlit-8R]|uniref:pentapeptide repeat-containing protein n=1 Tax=unclassified Halorubrum TaxID=2642239 RepID=UPI000EF1DB71|nr:MULTISPECIES: pentapeptide repeat-containing protein [unclassified Halorubrum]RLM63603.1 hypothetical protein DVK08_16900 [Halorubrum sp. Atlit-9R]RLM77078.1 hypothetical protein DVK05_15155 [Halorubrum sp. Atlit-8R]
MSGAASCDYVHDVGGERFDDVDGDEWRCPRDRYADTDYCVFHQPIRSLSERGVTPERIGEAIVDLVESEETDANRLFGAVCPGVDLEYAVVDGETTRPVDLRESWLLGPVECGNCRFANVVRFDGAVFESRVVFEDGTFAASASFSDAEFRGPAAFNLTAFRRWADVKDATFRREACFRGASFAKGLFGVGVAFRGAADFMNADFESVANFYDAAFERGGLFSSATFRGDAKFTACDLGAPVAVGTNFVDDPSLDDSELPYRDGTVPETCLALSSARCVGDLQLAETTAESRILVADVDLRGDVELRGMESASGDPITVDLRNVDSVSGAIEVTGDHVFDFGGSVLGDVRLEGVAAVEPDLDSFRFENAVFEGFDFGAYRSLFDRLEWRLHADDDATPSERENTYLRAKNGAIEVGENAAAREFHFRELLNRGRSHRRSAFGPADAGAGDLGGRLRFARKWLSNQVLRYTCGYGERPGRVVYASVGVIGVYALVYAWLGVELTYRGPFAPLAFSFQSFNALVLGIPEVSTPGLGVLVASEAFIGPFFVALFVFAITQAVGR